MRKFQKSGCALPVFFTVPIQRKAGLNNQRMALAGLCSIAADANGSVRLPARLVDLNINNFAKSGTRDIFSVFDERRIVDMLQAQALYERSDDGGEAIEILWEDCFARGKALLEAVPVEARPSPDLFVAVLAALRAATPVRDLAQQALSRIGDDVPTLQLRIEADWQRHILRKRALGAAELFVGDADTIFRAIRDSAAFDDARRFYTCCDLSGLRDWKKIQKRARTLYGIELLFKHDALDAPAIPASPMINAALDFEICLQSRRHIGPQLSTFFTILALTRAAQSPPSAGMLYRYDTPTQRLAPFDSSAFMKGRDGSGLTGTA